MKHRFNSFLAYFRLYFPFQNPISSVARPALDASSSLRRAGGTGSELTRREKLRFLLAFELREL